VAETGIERIEQWVVVMFENRSFDSLLGHLPHIDASDGLRGREVSLPYPGGSVPITGDATFNDPLPDPGEGYANDRPNFAPRPTQVESTSYGRRTILPRWPPPVNRA
jgi:phospholipase C